MRIAVISDVHGNLAALQAVKARLVRAGADLVVNLGDCVTAPLWPAETLHALADWNLPTVRGNHDRLLADDSPQHAVVEHTRSQLSSTECAHLAGLPERLDLADSVLAIHGTPASDTEYLLEESVDDRLRLAAATAVSRHLAGETATLVLCGHSHLQHAAMVDGRLVVNPGSVGAPRYAGNETPALNEAGSPHARYAIVERGKYGWSAEFHAVAYDWSVAVKRARDAGFAEWAEGFAAHA